MKKIMSTHKLPLIIFLIGVLFSSSSLAYAEESAVNITNEKPIEINLVDLREAFINQSKDVRDLKDTIDSIADAIANFDTNFRFVALAGDRSSGMKDQRKGSYYEYAYPNFVQMENLRAQLESLEITKETVETTLSFAADQLLSQYSLLKEQIAMYDQMILNTEKTYSAVQKKFELGSISKVDAENARIELENLKYNREKLAYQVENLKYNIMSLAGLEVDKTYVFQSPIFTDTEYDNVNLSKYYNAASEVSKLIYNTNRQMQALENEKKYTTAYRSYILKSDLLDFDRRYEEGIQSQESAKIEVYKSLRTYLSEFNRISDEIGVAETQIKYDTNFLDKLSQMEKLGQIVDTDRISYEIKVFQSELSKMSLENEKFLIGQKLELLISYGIKL